MSLFVILYFHFFVLEILKFEWQYVSTLNRIRPVNIFRNACEWYFCGHEILRVYLRHLSVHADHTAW